MTCFVKLKIVAASSSPYSQQLVIGWYLVSRFGITMDPVNEFVKSITIPVRSNSIDSRRHLSMIHPTDSFHREIKL